MMKNKNIIIAGASGRLGSELCERLVEEGVNVIALDINQEKLEHQKETINSDNFIFFTQDSSNAEGLAKVFAESEKRYGPIDGAINASYPRNKNYGASFFNVTLEDFYENVGLHMSAYFIFMQYCARYSLDKNKEFSLVNFSSIYGVIAPKFNIYEGTKMTMPVEYAAIKSGLIHLSKYVTSYTKKSKFRVNTISPGGIIDKQDDSFISEYKSHSRSKGMLDPEDILGAVRFLLSDDSEFICGQNIVIDDGFSI